MTRTLNRSLSCTAFLVLLTIAACRTGRDYQRPAVPLPAQLGTAPVTDTNSVADLPIQQFFTDTTLLGLINRGVAYNYDLQLALKRIDIASQQLKQAKVNWLPEVGLRVTGQTSRPSENSLNGISLSSFLNTNHIEDYTAAINLSWEIDVWGKIRRQKEAALARYLQTYEGAKAVQTQVVAGIAQGFYNLLMLDAQLTVARRNLSLSDSTLQITRLQRDAGEVTTLAVQQAAAQQQSTQALIPQLEQQVALQEHALSILTGELPGTIKRTVQLSQVSLSSNLSTGIPVRLVNRRPDVRANEMAVVAANAQLGAAQASMYPSLNITASGGLNSFKTSNWFNIPNSLFGLVLGSVGQPVFQRRLLKTQLEVARLQREQAVIAFKQSVLTAVGEVSDALVGIDKLQQQETVIAAQVDTLKGAVKNARLLFQSGMATYLEIITAQSNALQAELSLADIRRRRLSTEVELYRALGGGWQ